MSDNKQSICSYIWAGLEINANGTMRPCCEFFDTIKDQDGREFNIATDTIEAVIDSDYMKNIRNSMLAGEKPSTCNKCWEDERSGKESSLRQLANKSYPVQHQSLTQMAEPLQSIGMALGNICNLKCRICGPWASSVWASDEITRKGKQDATIQWEKNHLKNGAWASKTDDFWESVFPSLEQIKKINFYGGEPFMVPSHLALIKKISQIDNAKNIELYYNSNGTVFPDVNKETWDRFKKVSIGFSIDDIGDRFEYQRKNASWHEVVENIKKFQSLPKIKIEFAITVSVFNVFYLPEIVTELNRLFPDVRIGINVLRVVEYHSIVNLPPAVKDRIKEKLQAWTPPDAFLNDHLYVLNCLDSPNDPAWFDQLVPRIKLIDDFRREKLSDSHPELAELLNYPN